MWGRYWRYWLASSNDGQRECGASSNPQHQLSSKTGSAGSPAFAGDDNQCPFNAFSCATVASRKVVRSLPAMMKRKPRLAMANALLVSRQ